MNRWIIQVGILLLFTIANNKLAFSESLVQLGQIKRGNVHDISVVTLKNDRFGGFNHLTNQFVIAMRDSKDNLRLMVIEVSDSGHPSVVANVATEGTVKNVSVARVSSNRIITAVRDSEDKLRLIAFDIINEGRNIKRLGTAISQRIREVAIAGENNSASAQEVNRRVFTVTSDVNGKLFVADWKVNKNGTIKLLDSESYNGSASLIDVDNALSGSYFMTVAMKDFEGSLRLIAFQTPDQTRIDRGGFGVGGTIREVSSTGYDNKGYIHSLSISEGPVGVHAGLTPRDRYLVGAGILKIIRWAHKNNDEFPALIETSSNDLERKLEREITGPSRTEAKYQGMAETADIMTLDSPARAEFVTAHAGFGTFKRLRERDQGKPRLRIMSWDENLSVTSKTHLGGHYDQVELTPLNFTERETARFATVLRGSGELKVVVWGIR